MSIIAKSKEFIGKCVRVLKVARKPTRTELMQISKISALGLLIIGFLGFALSMVVIYLFGII
jgi:protein transport protein SEC61 subunit gamma-like protein